MQVDPLLTVADIAPLLGMNTKQVYDLLEHDNGEIRLPVVRIGRRIRFRAVDVQAWIDGLIVSSPEPKRRKA